MPTVGLNAIETQGVDYQWENGIELTALGVQQNLDADRLNVAFTWRAAQPINRNLKLFLHLLSAEGEIVAQSDSVPLGGRWPTTVWQNIPILDQHQIPIPKAVSAGAYQLRFGFYLSLIHI